VTCSWSCSTRRMNRWRKGSVDLQCGHDQVVCNVTCSWSCSIRRTNRRRKVCVDLQCGHDRVVYNVTCSWSCSTRRTNRRKKRCVDLQCGHDRVVWNVTCSWSCSTTWRNRRRKGCVDLQCGHDQLSMGMDCPILCIMYDRIILLWLWYSPTYVRRMVRSGIGTEELPCKLEVWKALPISWSQGAHNTLHTPLWFYPMMCHSCWPAIPPFTTSSLAVQPLGRVPPLPPPAAASSGYLNPLLKS
jgi:hypothetical protein